MDTFNQKRYTKLYSKQNLLVEKQLESERIINKVGKYLIKREKVLDVGCGVGSFAAKIKDTFRNDVYGIDLNEAGINNAIKLGIKARVGDIEKRWPFKSESFDAVVSIQTIEHLVNPDFFLLESKRVLKRNGLIIISTPNLTNWFNRVIFLFGFQPFFTEVSTVDKTLGLSFTRKLTGNRDTIGHIRVFATRALVDILNFYKYRIVSVMGGEATYLPKFMRPFDKFFSLFPGLSSDVIIVARKP
ncbi:MAG: class I SAM-dependent methyltransferase [Patescibacteria group bacterium]